MKRLKWLWIAWAVLIIPLSAAYAIDLLLLAPSCPDCHDEQTKSLPLITAALDLVEPFGALQVRRVHLADGQAGDH